MHVENFLSSWRREDGKNKEESTREVGNDTEEETGRKRIREEEREENETVSARRRCVGLISAETFDILSQEEDLESCGGVS